LETFCHDGNDGDVFEKLHLFADGRDVIADDAYDAGGVHKSCLWAVLVNEEAEGVEETLLPTEDDVFFTEVGGEAVAKEVGSGGEGTPDVPGVSGTTDGTVHEV
jgi:hypothetical protein